AVPRKCAYLEHTGGARRRRQQEQELSVLGGYLDRGHPRGNTRLPRRRQRVVLGSQHTVEQFVERLWIRLRHATNATAHCYLKCVCLYATAFQASPCGVLFWPRLSRPHQSED